MTGIITWIVFGFIAGAVAKFFMPGKDPGGWIITTCLGVAGSFLGGWLGSFIGVGNASASWNLVSFLTAVCGAFVLLFGYRFFLSRKAR